MERVYEPRPKGAVMWRVIPGVWPPTHEFV